MDKLQFLVLITYYIVAPYDEWKYKVMPFSYDHLTINLRKSYEMLRKVLKINTYENLRKNLGKS